MEKYYSRIEQNKLIFSLLRFKDITGKRKDLSPPEEYLQVCGRVLCKDVVIPAHRHLEIKRESVLTQESWVILEGQVRATFYDLDDSFLCEREVNKGDVIVLYRGGHKLEVLKDNTIFYEFKNGPYYGVQKDKEKINE